MKINLVKEFVDHLKNPVSFKLLKKLSLLTCSLK